MSKYTSDEKKLHVQKALAFVASGQGSMNAYCKMVNIPRSTFHKWVHKDKDKGSASKATANGLVRIKKTQQPISALLPAPRTISVDYYGARIEVTGEDALLALLKSIRAASNGLV